MAKRSPDVRYHAGRKIEHQLPLLVGVKPVILFLEEAFSLRIVKDESLPKGYDQGQGAGEHSIGITSQEVVLGIGMLHDEIRPCRDSPF